MTRGQQRWFAFRSDEGGFSVLEVIVGLALLALVLAALPGVLQLGRKSWRSAALADNTAGDMVAARFVRDRVGQSLPLLWKREDGALEVAFRGEAHALRFVSPMVEGPLGTGLFAFDLTAKADDRGGNALVLSWAPYKPTAAGNKTATHRVLIAELAAFDLRYFGSSAQTGMRTWSDTWADGQSLPELVEVRLVTPHYGQSFVVPLVAREVP